MRRRIAVLFSEFIFPYPRQTFAGIQKGCEERDVDLVALVCGEWRDPDPAIKMRSSLYDWIDPRQYDGFIIPFSSLSQHVGNQRFLEFLSPLLTKPHVFIGAEIEGHSSVIPDNTQGMEALADHLFHDHGIQRLVFVRGPVNHIGSNTRQEGLTRAVVRAGLGVGALTVLTNFSKSGLAGAIVNECETRGLIAPDTALLTVSEDVALSLLAELQLRGYRIPEDCIVCGSSATTQSSQAQPSLTTVENHHERVGYQAVEVLLSQWADPSAEVHLRSQVELVPRASCGCRAPDDPRVLFPGGVLELAAHQQADEPSWAAEFHSEFEGSRVGAFLTAVDQALSLGRTLLIQQGQTALFNHLHFFRQLGVSLISEFDLTAVVHKLRDRLGIRHAVISAFDPPGSPGPRSAVLVACRDGQVVDLPADQRVFETTALVPVPLRPETRSTYIVEAVFDHDRHFGLLAVDPGQESVLVLESIASQIAGSMHAQYQKDQISQLVHFDALTCLPNRRLLHDRLEQLLRQCRRSQRSFSVLYLDLDNFKQINDTHGHEAGDELLMEVAGLLVEGLRDGDTVARLGGDEFVVLLPEARDDSAIELVAGRILGLLKVRFRESLRFQPISASIGMALYPRDGASAADLLRHADEAMYRAKRSGKNAYSR